MSSIQSSFTNLGSNISLAIKYEIDEGSLEKALDKIRNKEIILFTMSGQMGSGKDTVGDKISSELGNRGYNLISTSFGYLIREEITELVKNYNEIEDKEEYADSVNANKEDLDYLSSLLKDTTAFDRTDESRTALQFWGTEVRRKQQNDYWINKMSRFIVNSVNKGYSVNVTDARFPNETQLIEDLLGRVIRLDVPEGVRIKRIELRDNIKVDIRNLRHVSETALDDYNFERTFDGTKSPEMLVNQGLEYLMNM